MKGREMKKGDTFVSVQLVDLAVTLFTLGAVFYDPVRPYIYQVVKGRRVVRFHFETASKFEEAPPITKMMLMWPDGEHYVEPLSMVAVCKRTIWERRWLLTKVNHNTFPELQELASGLAVVGTVKHASIAYALGFTKPKDCVFNYHGDKVFVVEEQVPGWLKPYCESLYDLLSKIDAGLDFIEAPGNELNPIAIASAAFINIVAWLEHLRSDKPYMQFTTASGKSYWVKEGSEKWQELLSLGYSPH